MPQIAFNQTGACMDFSGTAGHKTEKRERPVQSGTYGRGKYTVTAQSLCADDNPNRRLEDVDLIKSKRRYTRTIRSGRVERVETIRSRATRESVCFFFFISFKTVFSCTTHSRIQTPSRTELPVSSVDLSRLPSSYYNQLRGRARSILLRNTNELRASNNTYA